MTKRVRSGDMDNIKNKLRIIETVTGFDTADVTGVFVQLRQVNGGIGSSVFITKGSADYDAVRAIVESQLESQKAAAQAELDALGLSPVIADFIGAGRLVNVSVFYRPAIGGSYATTGSRVDSQSTFYAPTIGGSYAATGSRVDNVSTFYAPTVEQP